MPTHKFKIGQTVFIKPSFHLNVPGGASSSSKDAAALAAARYGYSTTSRVLVSRLATTPASRDAVVGRKRSFACHTMALRPTTSRVSATSITGERLALSVKQF